MIFARSDNWRSFETKMPKKNLTLFYIHYGTLISNMNIPPNCHNYLLNQSLIYFGLFQVMWTGGKSCDMFSGGFEGVQFYQWRDHGKQFSGCWDLAISPLKKSEHLYTKYTWKSPEIHLHCFLGNQARYGWELFCGMGKWLFFVNCTGRARKTGSYFEAEMRKNSHI